MDGWERVPVGRYEFGTKGRHMGCDLTCRVFGMMQCIPARRAGLGTCGVPCRYVLWLDGTRGRPSRPPLAADVESVCCTSPLVRPRICSPLGRQTSRSVNRRFLLEPGVGRPESGIEHERNMVCGFKKDDVQRRIAYGGGAVG